MNIEDPTLLQAALEGLEAQKARIEEQISKVKSLLAGGSKSAPAPAPAAAQAAAPAATKKSTGPRKRRKLSAEGRARIAEAQRKRWAASRKG